VDKASRQQQQPTITSKRGSIFFTDKEGHLIPAASTKQGYSLAINPPQITDPITAYKNITKFVPLDATDFFTKAAKKSDPYEPLATKIDHDTADKLLALKQKGVVLEPASWRVYPAGRLAAHVIGWMGYQGNEFTGRYGLEKQYQDKLQQQTATKVSFVSFLGDTISTLGSLARLVQPQSGMADVVLTIEPTVQNVLETELASLKSVWQTDGIGGIIIDPTTGEIIAMGALPNFDPGGKQTDIAALRNPVVEDVFELGSIIKPLTLAAALDAGVITANTTYNDTGPLLIDDHLIANHDNLIEGITPMQEVLNKSLNTGAVFAMRQLGKERFRKYFTQYGLTERTGIELPNEALNITSNLRSGGEVGYATAAFGQGIALTPISAARALSALANGGTIVKPRVVKALNYNDLNVSQATKVETQRTVLKPATSAEITRMLVQTFDTALANGRYKMEHYAIAAKTGTAQIADPAGGYYVNRYLHSFFGYFPAHQPRFLVLLYAVNPKGGFFAADTLTGSFVNITKFLLNYYNVSPDR
jgi:cell division protein FtsI/penicillin-binding protein 2